MAQIKKLSADLIAKIAAGQVVERPASIVKELIENSLDAKAKHITVELELAGKKRLCITDDGLGMSSEDLHLCYLHHTTSKLFEVTDLFAINSFGFRGEALSSIAAVAQIKIESKQKDDLAGNYIEIYQGTVSKFGTVGMPTGTRVVVSGLFAQIPARKKFLKSDATELTHILQTVTQLALANPKISFTMIHNKKTILELPENQSLLERSAQLLSDYVTHNLLPISIKAAHFQLIGYVGKPQIGTRSLIRQFLFVNDRSVQSKAVSHVMKEVFSSLLEPRSYPAFIFNLQLSPDLVDVNVDPKKSKVKFLIESELLRELKTTVTQVLNTANLTYSQRGKNGFYEEFIMDPGIAEVVRNQSEGWNIKDAELLEDADILQVHNLYLVAPTKNGILIIDQHAAHERILYQEFLQLFKKKRKETLLIEKEVMIELPLIEAEVLQAQLGTFQKMGFTISVSESARNSSMIFKVSAIPAVFKTRDIKKLIQELLHSLISQNDQEEMDLELMNLEISDAQRLDVGTHRTLAYLACRTAIKAGEKLTQKERKRLIEKLQETEGKYTCPHGRPVEVELDLRYLDQLFKRVK